MTATAAADVAAAQTDERAVPRLDPIVVTATRNFLVGISAYATF